MNNLKLNYDIEETVIISECAVLGEGDDNEEEDNFDDDYWS